MTVFRAYACEADDGGKYGVVVKNLVRDDGLFPKFEDARNAAGHEGYVAEVDDDGDETVVWPEAR